MFLRRYVIFLFCIGTLVACSSGSSTDEKIKPKIELPYIKGAALLANNVTINAVIDQNRMGTVVVSQVPTTVSLKQITWNDDTVESLDRALRVNDQKVSFNYLDLDYVISFSTETLGTKQGSEAEILDLSISFGIGQSFKVVLNEDKQEKTVIPFPYDAILPLSAKFNTVTLSTNATANYGSGDAFTIERSPQTLSFNVTSGDRSLTQSNIFEFKQNSIDSKDIIAIAFLPIGDNKTNSGSKKGIKKPYYGTIIESGTVNGNKILINLPMSTKDRLAPTIMYSGSSISPGSDAVKSAWGGGHIYRVSDGIGLVKTYAVSVAFTLTDEVIIIRSATFGFNSVSVSLFTTVTTRNVAIDSNFTFQFSHPVTLQNATGKIKIYKENQEIPVSITMGINSKELVVMAESALEYATSYTFVFQNTLSSTVDGTTFFLPEEIRAKFTTVRRP